MKLWQAILIGCDRREQGFGYYYVPGEEPGSECSCALGAAAEGAFGILNQDSIGRLSREFPILHKKVGLEAIADRIVQLNDLNRWTRERIALEFVKPLEEAQADE